MPVSVFQLFKIGLGPSSSHTVGPMRAAREFALKLRQRQMLPSISGIRTELFGSLAATGRGHGTDKAVLLGLMGDQPDTVDTEQVDARVAQVLQSRSLRVLQDRQVPFVEKEHLIFHRGKRLPFHTNGLRFFALGPTGAEIASDTYYSVGGGFIVDEATATAQQQAASSPSASGSSRRTEGGTQSLPFPFTTGRELLQHCAKHELTVSQVMMENEKVWRTEDEIQKGLLKIWHVMQECVSRGCQKEGVLPGPLQVTRRAPNLYRDLMLRSKDPANPMLALDWVNLFALAVNEENAAGGRVVTAPTNGAAGVIPAVMHYYDRFHAKQHPGKVCDFLLTAGAIGIIFKEGASISGAEAGCQGEVGVACSMAAAGLTAALGGSPMQIENAAEIGMEHNLGLTCDPIGGLVQIPCIERNAMGAVKAINATTLALHGDGQHKVSLDRVVRVMKRTGDDMKTKYKETARGGLALEFTNPAAGFDSVGHAEC